MGFIELNEEGRSPGPRALFITGYDKEAEEVLQKLLKETGEEQAQIILAREGTSSLPLKEVLETESTAPLVAPDKLPKIMVLSGMTHNQLRLIMQGFSSTNLPRPIFAVTTETNLKMSLKELIIHLMEEQKEVSRMREQNKKPQ